MDISDIKCIKCFPEIVTHSLPSHSKELNEQNKTQEEEWGVMTGPKTTP